MKKRQTNNYKHTDITERVIAVYYTVYNTLGYGFLEKVYENALYKELRDEGLFVQKQYPVTVNYKDERVGDYFADIIVEDSVILEIKAAESLCEEHEYQLVNYLRATDIEVDLMLNFGKNPEFKRKAFDNKRKNLEDIESVS